MSSEKAFGEEVERTAQANMVQDPVRSQYRIPITTYRLQLQPAFTFQNARAVVPYINNLGITDVYSSPFFRAKPGSTHGYDVCDFGQLNPELGGAPEFESFSNELTSHKMGLVLDFVPNHMAVEPVLNPWWRDMLEHGQSSPSAQFFDIDWNPVKPELHGKILLPFLGDHYGHVLDRGELVLVFQNGGLAIKYGDLTRPLDPKCYSMVLRGGLDSLKAELGDADPHFQKFLSILTALDNLPPTSVRSEEHVANRQRESRLAKERLSRLVENSPRIKQYIEESLASFNGTPGQGKTFDKLHELLEAQSYRLAYWKTAVHEINYRRFFDINQLAGLRVEEPVVFTAMHELVLKLIREGKVTGLRLDHIDGLFDPVGYLDRLQKAVIADRLSEFTRESNGQESRARGLCVVVEKILSKGESLPNWPMEGTTGYDFMNDVSRLFVNPRNATVMKKVYQRFTEYADPFTEVVYDCKKLITLTSLAAELNVLAHALNRISEGDRHSRDFTLDSLREALREVAACFPVYRTYLGPSGMTESDRQVIDQAIRRARQRNPATESSVFEFVRNALIPDRESISESAYQDRLAFAMKFQQYTGPLQAKGIEDTAFYRYNVLVSLNEVGGDPHRFGGTIAQFHQANRTRREQTPHALIATSTHDTKRGEDARTRIHVLSEIPNTWDKRIRRWAAINEEYRSTVDGTRAPSRNDEYLFYQTLIGIWPCGASEPTASPDFIARVRDYMLKATKEAKVQTSWITPNEEYDHAIITFIEKSLSGPRSEEFLKRFIPFQRRVAFAGMINSLAQLVLKMTSPGVPDFYQGTELWELSLVDPDNRKPVDYLRRAKLLAELDPWLGDQKSEEAQKVAVSDWLANWTDGKIKLFVTARGLRLRRQYPSVFLDGDYIPIEVEGGRAENVVAFARRYQERWIVTVVPRLTVTLTGPKFSFPTGDGFWGDTRLRMPESWTSSNLRNVLTQEVVPVHSTAEGLDVRVADMLTTCPVGLATV